MFQLSTVTSDRMINNVMIPKEKVTLCEAWFKLEVIACARFLFPENAVKKYRWAILIVIAVICVLLWLQTLNVLCDQDVEFFNGVCVINKFIPW